MTFVQYTDKKLSGKSKDEQMAEKKQELEKRLQDVTGQLGSAKKAAKKGKHTIRNFIRFSSLYTILDTKLSWYTCETTVTKMLILVYHFV